MIPFELSEIVSVLNAIWVGPNVIVQNIAIRASQVSNHCLFIALKGSHFDGHCFVNQAIFQGACALLVDHYLSISVVPQLIVSNTRDALSQLAFWVRKQVSTKIIAITGSSGKTSVKEMTASILGYCGRTIATYKNFNNEIGVPLTLLRLTHQVDFAIIEVGASSFGSITKSSHLILPDSVLVNNIFVAHLSGFKSWVGVAQAKGEIFSSLSVNGCCVLNFDSNAWFLWKHFLFSRFVWTFSINNPFDSDFFATNIIYDQNFVRFTLHTPYGTAPVCLSMLGRHSVSNALAASALALSVGATLSEVVFGLEQTAAIPGRLFPIFLGGAKWLLDDTYNANVGSVLAAVDYLNNMKGYRVIVIGDIAELGNCMEIEYHHKIGQVISKTSIDQVLTIGCLSYFISCVNKCGEHFFSKDMLIMRLIQILSEHHTITILVKGSRSSFMDQIVLELRNYVI